MLRKHYNLMELGMSAHIPSSLFDREILPITDRSLRDKMTVTFTNGDWHGANALSYPQQELPMTFTNDRPTILIVEPETGPRTALKVILRPFFNIYAVDTAHATICTIEERHVDLVTLDPKLPDGQGVNLLQEIKLEREDVEVIIITSPGNLESARECIRYGASAYLLKPFNVVQLVALIDEMLLRKGSLQTFCKEESRIG
jgi:response regulator RpfG family c-di-GMP phosphodiesterase